MASEETSFTKAIGELEPGPQYLAIVFTDIEGFSKRVEQETERNGVHAAVALKEEHDRLLRSHLGEGHSYIKSLGDGCLFLFRDMVRPFKKAVATQQTFKEHFASVPQDKRMNIRIGIHSGDVYIQPGDPLAKWYSQATSNSDPLSDAVNLAHRIMDITPAGSVHVSDQYLQAFRWEYTHSRDEKSIKCPHCEALIKLERKEVRQRGKKGMGAGGAVGGAVGAVLGGPPGAAVGAAIGAYLGAGRKVLGDFFGVCDRCSCRLTDKGPTPLRGRQAPCHIWEFALS